MAIDYLGDEMPSGYEPWMCPTCTAVCNFEAMTQCVKAAKTERYPGECGFDRERPESNGGAFGFMKLTTTPPQTPGRESRTRLAVILLTEGPQR